MARIRSIKPDFFRSEDVARLTPLARLLFIGLWTIADREGRLLDRPRRISVDVFPYDDDFDIGALLAELTSGGVISRYEADGKKCIQIANFLKHQRPHPKEPPSTVPPESTDSVGQNHEEIFPAVEGNGETRPGRLGMGSGSGSGIGNGDGVAAPAPARDPGATEPMPEFRLWPAGRWLYWFSEAWDKKYGAPYIGGQSDSKACGTLDGNLGRLSEPDRLNVQAKAGAMFEAFLSDPSADAAGHPFSWFVERWGLLRLNRRPPPARGSPGTRAPSTATREAAARYLEKHGELP